MSDFLDISRRRPIQTVSLSFHRFASPAARLWVLGQMGAARIAFSRMPDVGFWKLCGSGTGEGFTPIPNTAVWAILATWPDEARALVRVTELLRLSPLSEPLYRRWRDRAAETWTVFLSATSVRGAWSGAAPFQVGDPADGGPDGEPIAALTRATIRPGILTRFWSRVPAIEDVIGQDPNVIFKIGIGEVPWLHQVTFSIWPDARAMAEFARADGPHARAIRAVRDGGWFREELYARFRILGDAGTWGRRNPLERLERSAA